MATKYVEELEGGDVFLLNNEYFSVSTDYKKNGDKMCVSLKSGNIKWVAGNSVIDHTAIYTMDSENNLVSIKPIEKPKT
jgi:hypothetical protein